MIPDQSLVNTPEAVEFINNAKLPTQRNVMLGDLNKFRGEHIYNSISESHYQLERAADTIGKLTQDVSRNEVEKHVAAKKVADQTIAQLETTQRALLAVADANMRDVNENLAQTFKLAEGRSAIHVRMADWIIEQSKVEGGYARIREAVTSNSEFAAVIENWPPQLLNLPDDQRTDFRLKAVERWSPETKVLLDRYLLLRETAAKYPGVIRRVSSSFYSKIKAAKIHKRVAV